MGGKDDKDLTFEDAMKKLEAIVSQLEDGSDSLEKSLELFEEGVKLTKYCNEKLDEAERKIEVLVKKGSGLTKKKIEEEELFEPGKGNKNE